MKKLIYSVFGKPISRDKGVRGTASGKLYIDKKVFFRRKEVQKAINDIYSSEIIKHHIKTSNS